VQLADGNAHEAVRLYALSWNKSKQSIADFSESFRNDWAELEDAKISPESLPFILDSVFYS
jgi:hypothetical protein